MWSDEPSPKTLTDRKVGGDKDKVTEVFVTKTEIQLYLTAFKAGWCICAEDKYSYRPAGIYV